MATSSPRAPLDPLSFLNTGPLPATSRSRAVPSDSVSFKSKDYHGLTRVPEVIAAAQAALASDGAGAGAARAESPSAGIYRELERRLAAFRQVEGVLSFQTGFMANLGMMTTVVGRADTVLYDEMSHASIADAVTLAGARSFPYPHKDTDALEQLLRRERETGHGNGTQHAIVVATDTVFGMEGDVAPLPAIVELAEEFGAATLFDDAHGLGVLGAGGRGAIDHFDLHGRVDIEVATLSKALGAIGGFAGCRTYVRDRAELSSHPLLYSTAPPAYVAAAVIAALGVLEREPQRVDRLRANADYLRMRLTEAAWNTGESTTAIVPILVEDQDTAIRLWTQLGAAGIEAQLITGRRRVTPRIRLIVRSEHSQQDLDRCIDALSRVGHDVGVG